jgi:O-antigen/teichoic acid export membrane protein
MKKKVSIVIFLISLIVFTCIFNSQVNADETINVLLVGSDIENAFLERITLDPLFSISNQSSIGTDLTDVDCIVLLDYNPTWDEILLLNTYDEGLVIFIGENLASNSSLLINLGFSSSSTATIYEDYSLPVITENGNNHSIIEEIQWNSVPTLANYTDLDLSGVTLVETSSDSENPGLPLITSHNDGKNIVMNFYPLMDFNTEFIEWPFFNYFLYLSITTTSNNPNLSYAKWKFSPVPHTIETTILGVSVLLTIMATSIGFIYARKYTKNNPIRKEDLEEISKEIKTDERWENVGMHRQLGGFLIQLFLGLLIILPNVVMSALVFPLIILPSPQAAGFYDFTIRFFEALWLFFDLGTSIVLVKFFSEHRVKRPQQAIKYVQIFVWYQMLSGIAQLFLISFLGSMIFPHTFLAHMTWIFVTHAFFQWPAFFLVFMYLFQAMNRIDYYQILNILLYGIFNISLQYVVIVIFRFTLGKNPIFGDGLAGAIGYSVGFYVIQVTSFFIGLWMFKRLGFSLRSIFRIDFSRAEIKEALRFGLKWMLGAILPPLGWFIQLYLLSTFLPNYTQQQGFFSIAWNFAMIVMLVGLFLQGILPAISESYHAKKKVLTRYYTVSALKWAAYFDWYLVAGLAAVGWRFILGGAGAEWADASILIIWFLMFHSIGYFSWLGDWAFAGSDRPGWAAISWIIEQVLRAGILAICIPRYAFFSTTFNSPMVAIMFAYFPALIVKNIFMWWQIRRDDYFKFKWKDLLWQGVAAPLFAALLLFGIFEGLFRLIWQGEIITSVVILLIGTLVGLYIFAFLASWFGAFDDNTLKELKKATGMAKGFGFMAKPLYKVTEWASKISPLHNKFPISIYDEALKEAKILTEEKTKLII